MDVPLDIEQMSTFFMNNAPVCAAPIAPRAIRASHAMNETEIRTKTVVITSRLARWWRYLSRKRPLLARPKRERIGRIGVNRVPERDSYRSLRYRGVPRDE